MRIAVVASILVGACLACSPFGFRGLRIQDALYRQAERHYLNGEWGRAEAWVQAAAWVDPDHAPSKALLTEIHFASGRGRSWAVAGVFPEKPIRPVTENLLSVLDALEKAEAAALSGNPQAARAGFRRVLHYLQWFSVTVETQAARRRAEDGLFAPRPQD